MKRRVVITGVGVVSPVGNDAQTFGTACWKENQALTVWLPLTLLIIQHKLQAK